MSIITKLSCDNLTQQWQHLFVEYYHCIIKYYKTALFFKACYSYVPIVMLEITTASKGTPASALANSTSITA